MTGRNQFLVKQLVETAILVDRGPLDAGWPSAGKAPVETSNLKILMRYDERRSIKLIECGFTIGRFSRLAVGPTILLYWIWLYYSQAVRRRYSLE